MKRLQPRYKGRTFQDFPAPVPAPKMLFRSRASKDAPHSPTSPRRVRGKGTASTSTSALQLRMRPKAKASSKRISKRRKQRGANPKLAVSALSVLATDASLLATTASDSTL